MTDQEKFLLEHFKYDPSTGILTRIKVRNRHGDYSVCNEVGTECHGYLLVTLKGKKTFVHRIAFLFMTGKLPNEGLFVDHINGNRQDNRWENLRLTTRSQNQMNITATPSNNTSGHKGVHKINRPKTKYSWFARIKSNRQTIHLGVFETFDQALVARKQAEEKYFGNFKRDYACTNSSRQ